MKNGFRWLDRLNLQDEPTPGQPLVELLGKDRVIIENHRGVAAYCPEYIAVRVRYGCICVHGKGLVICRMCRQQLVICGEIDGVKLEREGET